LKLKPTAVYAAMEQRRWLQAWLALLLVLFLLSVGWRNLPEEQSQAQYSRPSSDSGL